MTVSTPSSDRSRPQTANAGNLTEYLVAELAPQVAVIDSEGHYPRAVMQGLGQRGGFGTPSSDDDGVDPARQVQSIAAVGRYCGSTAFLVWCQSACAWYLARAPRTAPRQRYLASVLEGTVLAGTGMSNFLKHHSGIEKIRLRAEPEGEGYRVSGVLPWVSNLDRGHLLFTAAEVAEGGYIMFAVDTAAPGLKLHPCPAFSGMEGTGTWNVRLEGVSVPAADVLAGPEEFEAFINSVKPGLIATQAGMGLGVTAGCLDILDGDRTSNSEVNGFLETGAEEIREALGRLENDALTLTRQAASGEASRLSALKLRAEVSELTLRAAQSTALRVGARGYLMRHPAQRRLREAMFVAIVTPALKHLRKEIHDIEQGSNAEVA